MWCNTRDLKIEVRKSLGLNKSVGVKMGMGMLRCFGHVERMSGERLTKQIPIQK